MDPFAHVLIVKRSVSNCKSTVFPGSTVFGVRRKM